MNRWDAETREALLVALQIAKSGAEPPIRTHATLIPAHLIAELRAALTALGIRWQD